MSVSVIICAAGKGKRAQLGKNKVLAPLFGQPLIYTVTEKFFGKADQIIIVCSPDDREQISMICAPFRVTVCDGGETRFDSVYNALNEVKGDIVLIHDGARPFVTEQLIDDCISRTKMYGSAICAVPVTDTIAACSSSGIVNIPDRSSLYSVQTPQGFFTKDIKSAYQKAKEEGGAFTDDSSVYLKYIGTPHIVAGSTANTKLTFRRDFERQYPRSYSPSDRIGFGSDVHCFGGDNAFVTLCGVRIPSERGLIAHSDGDVPVHALMDAILSAAGLEDIGHYFPDSDAQYENADSLGLLKKVVRLINEKGLVIVNISVAIQAEEPRLSSHIEAMIHNLSETCGIEAGCIGISAGTGEGLGFVGKKMGISATAAVLLKKII